MRTFVTILCCITIVGIIISVEKSYAQSFEDKTAEWFGGPYIENGRSAWGDYNNDGWVDLNAMGTLYRNNGGTGFTQITDLYSSGIFGDFDNDGDGVNDGIGRHVEG